MFGRTAIHLNREVKSLPKEASVGDACRLMAGEDIGSVVVLDGRRPIGIVTERDVVRKVVARGLDCAATTLEEVMSGERAVIGPDTSMEEALALMRERGQRHLPVSDGESLVGVVSMAQLSELAAYNNESLLAYINGTYPR